jgi:GNAT superfamily N-acetyltransferase
VIDISQLKIVRLEPSYTFLPFDCLDTDLNDFLLRDSKNYLYQLLAVTYLVEYQGVIIAFFSLSNDKITAEDCDSGNRFKKLFKEIMPDGKQYKSYPSVKLGRFAIHKDFQKQGLGSRLLDYIKGLFLDKNKTGCQYLTVDAYGQSLEFYQKNGFEYFSSKDKDKDTRQMYFSLVDLARLIGKISRF